MAAQDYTASMLVYNKIMVWKIIERRFWQEFEYHILPISNKIKLSIVFIVVLHLPQGGSLALPALMNLWFLT